MRLFDTADVGEGFAHIPAGPARLGGDRKASNSLAAWNTCTCLSANGCRWVGSKLRATPSDIHSSMFRASRKTFSAIGCTSASRTP